MDNQNILRIINLILSLILLALNTGAFLHYLSLSVLRKNRIIKYVFILFTGALELTLLNLFINILLKLLGFNNEIALLINNINGFVILVLLIILETILYLLSKNKIR